MFLKFFKNTNNVIVNIISINGISLCIDADITATAKNINKSINFFGEILLNRVYYPVFVTYIINGALTAISMPPQKV